MERLFSLILFAFILNLVFTRTEQQNGAELDKGSGFIYSGDGDEDDDDEVTRSTKTEGSGGLTFETDETALTPCQRQQLAAGSGKSPGAFPPQCTSDGQFKATQCNSRQCWCVDKEDGKKNPGTETVLPKRPKCGKSKEMNSIARTRKPLEMAPDFVPEGRVTDDITIDEPSSPRPMESEKNTVRRTPKTQSTTTSHGSGGDDDELDVDVNTQKPAFYSFLFKDPLIFAGIVGGVVLALLCIVLLVMFTIYRMRKKDEGSYALDEPKKSYGFAYTRAKDKEFFA